MTRSVEIPEQAVVAAVGGYDEVPTYGTPAGKRDAMRNALSAALPYLAPAEDAPVVVDAHAYVVGMEEAGCANPRHADVACPTLAPAGDGGLREALEQTAREKIAEWYGAEWDASEDKFYETYDGGGISCVDEEAMLELRGVRLALDLALAAHSAAPAVPQPVDREAVAKALADAVAGLGLIDARDMQHPRSAGDIAEVLTAAVLAVLAGEQEQVEP